MTALTLERIEELRAKLKQGSFEMNMQGFREGGHIKVVGRESQLDSRGGYIQLTVPDVTDLLALLDKEAARLKDAKAGATCPDPAPHLGEVDLTTTHPLYGMEWVDSLLCACHKLNEGRPDHQAWIDEARSRLAQAPSPDPEDERVLKIVDNLEDLYLGVFKKHTEASREDFNYLRSRLAGVRVTREWMHLFAEHLTHNNWDDAIAMLQKVGVCVGGDDEK